MAETAAAESAAVRKSLVGLAVTLVIMAAMLFVPAGTLNWPRGWWFGAAFIVAILGSVAILWRVNPEIFVARSRVQPGTRRLDYLYITAAMSGFFFILPVAALDFRFGWAQTPDWAVWLGYLLFFISFAGVTWPQAVNRHFEPGVRLQRDRGQTVIDTGPYAMVRHPGYIMGSLLAVSIPLCLGSWWAMVPAVVVILALIPRTLFEERTLIDGLAGYREYTQRVRFRWVPGLW